jgi:RNA polymerase sigma factor (sigma-70 family)
MQKRRAVAAPTPIYEDLFIQRYERLLTWALQLTDRDRELAEDLVHDIFIQFTLSQPDLSSIDNLEGYLRVMLRNMHLSQVRRSTRIRENASAVPEISLINHDSMESWLRAVEERTVAHVQQELRRICQYACIRKETSKAGSVLILRFFHGYYPSEIAKILRVTRGAVDEFLSIARAEARAFLNDPNSLAFMAAGKVSGPSASASEQTTEELVRELRAFIFAPQDPDCLPPEKLRELYLSDQGSGPGAALLCHVVSCRRCLDEVNRVLDLPPLSARNLTDTLQKEKRPKNNNKDGDGSSGTSSGGEGFVQRYRRRLKETFEHRPKELRISVNGIILGAHSVSSELSKQTISVNLEERIGFVEILSEKEVRLLFAVVEPPPDGPAERKERVSLSDGRTLDLTLSFSESRPHLYVVYHDPLFQIEGAEQVSSPKEAREAGAPSQDGTEGSAEATGLLNPIRRLRQRLLNWSFWLRPGTVTAVFALVLISVVLFIQLRREPSTTVSAAELLQRSSETEESIASRPDTVLHRTINMEEKNSAGVLTTRRRIEMWQSAERGVIARRLYDERGQLVAGDWRRADGVQTVYSHGSRPQLQLAPEKRPNAPIGFNDVWQLSPSARDFTAVVGDTSRVRVEERPTTYVISYVSGESGGSRGVVRASLVLSRADLHPTEQTLLVRQGSEEREYRFVEASFERRPTSAVAPAVFEPDAELLGAISRHVETVSKIAAATEAKPLAPVIATADLEVEVLRLLNQAGADLDDQTSVTRAPEGRLRVGGLVEDKKRKDEILRALGPVINHPAVKVEIETVTEASRRQQRSLEIPGVTSVERVEVAGGRIPVSAELSKYFGKEEGQADEEVRRFASRVLNRSSLALSRAGTLKRLVGQFSQEDLRTMSPEARTKLLALVRSHARSFEQETRSLRQELQPIFFPDISSVEASGGMELSDDESLQRAIEKLFRLASANDRALRSAFSISAENAQTPAVKSSQFGRELLSSERLATSIQKVR